MSDILHGCVRSTADIIGANENEDVLISAHNVSKRFCRNLRSSMKYGFVELARNLLGLQTDWSALRKDEFWALKDIDFELKRGDVLGLMGANGSGKSTLLRLLCGIFPPDNGEIMVRGRVGALIAVGAGFHPHMSGRENIYLNGSILGMSKQEVDERFDAIVDFAEIKDFLDAPVSTYSSGMRVRLGFSIAVQIEPDVLLIDEILAVGDVGFRAKCYNYLTQLTRKSAVVLVSHSVGHISRYCNRAILLDKGRVVSFGKPSDVYDAYYSMFNKESSNAITFGVNRLHSLELLDEYDNPIKEVRHGGIFRIKGCAAIEKDVRHPIIDISFYNRELVPVAQTKSDVGTIVNEDGVAHFSVDLEPFLLNVGDYKITLTVFDEKNQRHLLWHVACWEIKVVGDFHNYDGAALFIKGRWA